MSRSRHPEAQMIGALKQVEADERSRMWPESWELEPSSRARPQPLIQIVPQWRLQLSHKRAAFALCRSREGFDSEVGKTPRFRHHARV